jgi:hypothetical protein
MDDTVMIVGEIFGSEIAVTMMGVAYDEDNEILGSQENKSYPSSGLVSHKIKFSKSCNLVPFKINIDVPVDSQISSIRIYPKAG